MVSHVGNTSNHIVLLFSPSLSLLLVRSCPTVPTGVCVCVCVCVCAHVSTCTLALVCTHVFISAHILEAQKMTAPPTEGWAIASQDLRLSNFQSKA